MSTAPASTRAEASGPALSAPPLAPLPMDKPVQRSLRHCRAVARKQARNFYHGMRLTPEPKRSAIYTVYAFMRACDDLVDGDTLDEQSRATDNTAAASERLKSFRAQMDQALAATGLEDLPDGPVWPAFRYVMGAYPVDPAHLRAMLDGQRMDLSQTRYATFDELYGYCYNVASTVGLVCVSVWGTVTPEMNAESSEGAEGVVHATATKLAEYRGIALQLTNILRDVREDAQRGRVYLPGQDLEKFGVTHEELADPHALDALGQRFDRLMRFQIERARSYYAMSATLERHIEPRCRPTCWAIMQIYRQLLERIAQRPRRVLADRVRLSKPQKLLIAGQAGWKRTWAR